VGTTQTLNSIITGVTAVRASNSIGYFLPGNLGGFYGQVQYYLGENNSNVANKDDGTGYGLRLGFANGPFNVALGLSRTKYAAGDVQQNNIAGQWDFGVAKLMGEYSFDKNEAVTSGKGKGYLIGGLIPVGAGEIRLAYSRYKVELAAATPTAKKYAIGYDYNLSKRTVLYATYAHVSNSGGSGQALNGATLTSPNDSSSGYDFGIRHAF
jgi:predicted porin